jgi:hypothetical protein
MAYLARYLAADSQPDLPGCQPLPIRGVIPHTHAMVYHRSAYDLILDALADNAADLALGIRKRQSLADFYAAELRVLSFLIVPAIANHALIVGIR